jgi:hypothetical protein
MTTEFPDQKSDSDLCVHRASVVKSYRARCSEPQINHRVTMDTEFPDQKSESDLYVHRASAVKAIVLGAQKSRLTPEAR